MNVWMRLSHTDIHQLWLGNNEVTWLHLPVSLILSQSLFHDEYRNGKWNGNDMQAQFCVQRWRIVSKANYEVNLAINDAILESPFHLIRL